MTRTCADCKTGHLRDHEYRYLPSGESGRQKWCSESKDRDFKFLRPEGHIVLNGDDGKLITVKEYEKIKPVFSE